MTVLLFFAFLSGIVTILSPCILPVLPIVLSGSVGGKRRPLGVILGFVAGFSLFTLALSTLVRALDIPPDTLRIAAVILIISFGAVMAVPRLRGGFELLASRMTGRRRKQPSMAGFTGGILVGVSLGLLWTPCVGPIMASVISLAVTRSVDGGTVLIILAYSLGTSIPMLAIMAGGRSLIKRFSFLSKNPARIQRIFGVFMILVGLSIGFGLDRRFQSTVLRVFPGYGSGLTAFENSDPVREALEARDRRDTPPMMSGAAAPASFGDPPEKGRLGDYGAAPEIITAGGWINSPGLDMEELKGKVVLIDFWTYSCVNCVRTIPHLRALHEAYGDEGLVIIGVHTPEFAFERRPANVRRAMEELGVTWPVVLDNEYAQWRAYGNRYWPAHYFIDGEGRVRYFQFGEGRYDEAEKVVRALLDEGGAALSRRAEKSPEAEIESRTPEIYLGYDRAAGFRSKIPGGENRPVLYRRAEVLKNGEWSLDGTWTVAGDFVIAEGTGVLELGFEAKNVFLVIEPLGEGGSMEVRIDGAPGGDTTDVRGGVLRPGESRLYQLVALPRRGEHILNLKVAGTLRLFAFTFG